MNIKNPEQVVESPESEIEEAELAAYWTEERMANAEALPFSIPRELVDDSHLVAPQLEELMMGESQGPDSETFQPRPRFSTSPVQNINILPYQ